MVGGQSKQNLVPLPQMVKRSYTYDAIMRLNNIENCLIDTQKSRDEVVINIGQILEREKIKLALQREKSSCTLRLSRYRAEITDQSKALEEERQHINSLRENIRSRRAALEDAKYRYRTGNEYLEESYKRLKRDRVDVLSEALFLTTSKLCARQRELVAELLTIYPIEQVQSEAFSFKILGVPLQNSVFAGCDEDQVATALGFTCHLIHMLAYYLGVPLRFPMTPMSSRSIIRDPISASLLNSRQGYVTEYVTCRMPFKWVINWIIYNIYTWEGCCTNNQLGVLFPLYSRGSDRYRFEYAVFLLNKNIEQLMHSQGLLVMDLRHTLPNLNYLILGLISTSPSQAFHLRKAIPHNCTVLHTTSNGIPSGSNSALHHHNNNYLEDHSRSSSRSSTPASIQTNVSNGFEVG